MKKLRYSRRLIAAAAVVASLGIGTIGIGTTFAAGTNSPGGELVQAIADKFNLDVNDVQAVFDEQREKMEAVRAEREQERLDRAVSDGTLTQDQADAIVEKRVEVKAFVESLKDMDESERREAMKTEMEEVKAWAEENDLPLGFVLPHPPGRGHHQGDKDGMGRMGEREE